MVFVILPLRSPFLDNIENFTKYLFAIVVSRQAIKILREEPIEENGVRSMENCDRRLY